MGPKRDLYEDFITVALMHGVPTDWTLFCYLHRNEVLVEFLELREGEPMQGLLTLLITAYLIQWAHEEEDEEDQDDQQQK